jgi:hypothetical protein
MAVLPPGPESLPPDGEKEKHQMKRIGIMGLCLAAVCAMSALTTATASAALPEWGKCVKFVNAHGKNVGNYENPGCTKKTEVAKTGGWEWKAAPASIPNPGFTSHGGAAVLETTLGSFTSVLCPSEEAHGSLSGSKGVSEVSVLFKGCHLSFGANEGEFYTCGNGLLPPVGEAKEGEIVTRHLKGKLGYISGKGEENPSVGLTLEPEEKKSLFAQFMCAERFLVIRVGGFPGGKGNDSIISPIGPVDSMSVANTQTYTQTAPGIQNPTHFEGGKEDYLETETSYSEGNFGPIAQSAQSLTTVNQLNSGEEIEIRAFVH